MKSILATIAIIATCLIINFFWLDQFEEGDTIKVRKYELQPSQQKLWVGDEEDIIVRKDAIFLYTQKGRRFSLLNYLKDDFIDI